MIQEQLSERCLSRINSSVLFSIIILGLLVLLSFLFIDERLFSFIHNRYGESWCESNLVKAAGQFGKAGFLVWLLLVLISVTGRSRAAVVALLALLLVLPVLWPTKVLTCRPRPRDVIEKDARVENLPVWLRSWSFPSGDAASAFAVATALTPFVSAPLAIFFFVIAGVVGVTRILIFAHYLSDVLGGAVVGILAGWLALWIVRKKIPPSFMQFHGYRIIAAIGIILTPFLVYLSGGCGRLTSFLEASLVFLAAVYLISLIDAQTKEGNNLSS